MNKSISATAIALFICVNLLCSCGLVSGPAEAVYDNFNYESITNEKGTVKVKFGDSILIYPRSTIVYSEADASTMLIKTDSGKYVYIQGPAIVEFDNLNVRE